MSQKYPQMSRRRPRGRRPRARRPRRLPLTRAPVDPSYDYTRATADNYRAAARINDDIWSISHNSNGGPFKHIRDSRDHAFHGVYAPARQRLQDKIVEHYVNFRSGWNLPGPESSIRNTASIVDGVRIHEHMDAQAALRGQSAPLVKASLGDGQSTLLQVALKRRFPEL